MWMRFFVLGIAAFLASCTKVVWVKESATGTTADLKGVPGIPFYVKTEKLVRKSVWVKTWLRATLTVKQTEYKIVGGNKVDTASRTYSIERQVYKSCLPTLNELLKRIVTPESRSSKVAEQIIVDFIDLKPIVDVSKVEPDLFANTLESMLTVDTSRTYYLNAPLPWIGTGSLTQELSPDGTLSKVAATADSKIGEGLAALIPLKEYLTGRFVSEKEDKDDEDAKPGAALAFNGGQVEAAQEKEPIISYELSLAVEEIGYEYTVLEQYDDKKNPPKNAKFRKDDGEFTRRSIGGSEQAEAKTEEGPTINVSGTISLPKQEPAEEPKKEE